MRKFNYEPEMIDPSKIAMEAQQEHLVEAILDHMGGRQDKTKMDFKVRSKCKWIRGKRFMVTLEIIKR